MKRMYVLYSLGMGALLVLTSPWWLMRMLRHGKYRAGLKERLGRVPARLMRPQPAVATGTPGAAPRPSCIWVHAVSVGEVLAVSGLIGELRERFPARRVVISTTTATGQMLGRNRFGEENVFYFPLDFAFAIRPYLRALRPELVIVAETEFWPNFLHLAHGAGARIAVVNARVSDRSFPRYRLARGFMRTVLNGVDAFLAQSEEDARRLRAMGAAAARVTVSGNLKFDLCRPQEAAIVGQLRRAFQRAGAGRVIVCGSTLEREEEIVLRAFQKLLTQDPASVMVLAPRHPERFAAVAELLRGSGIPFWRRSAWNGDADVRGGVFLLDSIGELASMYALAHAAFVGGSLVPRGGHNILEPAQFGVPVIVGPYTGNFRDIIELFRRENAVIVAQDERDFSERLCHLLIDRPRDGQEFGARAAQVLRQHSGAAARTLDALQRLMAPTPAKEVPAGR